MLEDSAVDRGPWTANRGVWLQWSTVDWTAGSRANVVKPGWAQRKMAVRVDDKLTVSYGKCKISGSTVPSVHRERAVNAQALRGDAR